MTKSERVRQQFKARFDGVLFDYSGETGKWIRDEKLTNQLADAAMVVWKLFEEQDAQMKFHLMGSIYTNPKEYTK